MYCSVDICGWPVHFLNENGGGVDLGDRGGEQGWTWKSGGKRNFSWDAIYERIFFQKSEDKKSSS